MGKKIICQYPLYFTANKSQQSIPTESCSVALTLQSQSLLLILCSGFFLYNSQELVTDAFRWQTK